MSLTTIEIGDVVAIRGDLQWNHTLNCCKYTPDQMIDGKYLRHTGHGGIWTGKVEKIKDNYPHKPFVLVGGMWYAEHLLEVMYKGSEE